MSQRCYNKKTVSQRMQKNTAAYVRACRRNPGKEVQEMQQTSKYCEINYALPYQRIGFLSFMRWSCVAWWFHKQMRWPALVYTRSDFIFVWAIDFVYSSPPLADNGSSAKFVPLANHRKFKISLWLHEAKATAPCMNGFTWYQSST
jgi:hypothetical protein